jgi:nitrogen fixation/metabolism regulation signal transduction histidine kinase
MLKTILSWLINAGIMAMIVAAADEKRGMKIEEHQLLAWFLVLVIPTLMELASAYFVNKPFLYWILGG